MWIPDEIRKGVVFMGYEAPDGMRLAGTGFVVSMQSSRIPDFWFEYVVTAKHVIRGIELRAADKQPCIRINDLHGDAFVWGTTTLGKWFYHPDDPFIDVAVMPFGGFHNRLDYMSIPMDSVASEDDFKKFGIGIGDEVAIVGLFSMHYGRRRNIPIVRIGNIAALAEERLQIKMLNDFVDADAFFDRS